MRQRLAVMLQRLYLQILEETGYIPRNSQGLYSVHCHPVGGTPDPSLFVNLYKAICEIPGAELRLCPDESFYVINCREEDLEAVLHVTEDSAKTIFEESVACIGAHVCQQGIRDSQGLLQKLVEMEKETSSLLTVSCQRSIFPAARLPAVPTRSV